MRRNPIFLRCMTAVALAAVTLSAIGLSAVQPVYAGELDKIDSSLKLIPADASFYGSMLRNRQQYDAFVKSNAFAKIKAMPAVQLGLSMYAMQSQNPNSPAGMAEKARENPEAKRIINLFADMVSNDIFFYGDKDCIQFVELAQNLMSALRYQGAILDATGEAKNLHGKRMEAKIVIDTLSEHIDQVKIPNVLIGFRLKKPSAASEALIKLEMLLNVMMEAAPELKGHLNRETIDETEYHVLRLNGQMIHWNKIPLDEIKKVAKSEADFQKLIDHVKAMEFVIALGVRENDLLVSIGSSTDCIKKLGTGPRLLDRPELKPMEKFADKPLVSVGYVSKEFNEHINNNVKNIDDLRDFLVQMLPLAKLTDAQTDQLSKDIESFAEDIKSSLPALGAVVGFEFLTDKGYEGYQYAWGANQLDGSKPLSLLNHVSGSPILALVGRAKHSDDKNGKLEKWAQVVWKDIEELALPRIPEKDRAQVAAVLADVKPLLIRLHTTMRDMLGPALADGQIGFVVDAKLLSKQFIQTMPELKKELPMLRPAIVVGVSDANLLRKAMGELYAIANDAINVARKYNPEIPVDLRIPDAKVSQATDGTLYTYTVQGVDSKIVPNAGLSDKVAVLSLSTDQTELLLKDMPLKVDGVLTNTDRPLAVAAAFDWSELVKAITPWVNYALEQMSDQQLAGQKGAAIAQANTILEVLGTIKNVTSETYVEGDHLVSHTQLEIHDLSN